MDVRIKVIPHRKQPYPTAGYWEFDRHGNLLITVSEMGSENSEMLVAIHELVEAVLCRNQGISGDDVTAFDVDFEKRRAADPAIGNKEPGDDPAAPYFRAHQDAMLIEIYLANRLGVNWFAHEANLHKLP